LTRRTAKRSASHAASAIFQRGSRSRYRGTHRRKKQQASRLLARATATLTIVGSLLLQPLAAGTAHAADGCTGATPSTTFICAERVLTNAVDSVASVQQLAGASVPVPGPIVVQSNLLDEVNQAANQVTQAANDCLTNPDSVCAVRVQT